MLFKFLSDAGFYNNIFSLIFLVLLVSLFVRFKLDLFVEWLNKLCLVCVNWVLRIEYFEVLAIILFFCSKIVASWNPLCPINFVLFTVKAGIKPVFISPSFIRLFHQNVFDFDQFNFYLEINYFFSWNGFLL